MRLTIAILSVLLGVSIAGPNGYRQSDASEAGGPKCDGSSDDTASIQRIIDAALRGDHHVRLPRGICIIAPPNPDFMLSIGSSLTIEGQGPADSVLKVKNGAGNYSSVFGPKWAKIDNLTLRNLAIDYNSAQNPPSTFERPRFVVSTARGSNSLVIENVLMRNIDSINAIYSASDNTTIRDCRFEMSSAATVPHDHSTIYIAAEKSLVEGNNFVGAINRAASVTAIEMHGGEQAVQRNTISGYFAGMNITGIAPRESKHIEITNNKMSDVYHGIAIWSNTYRSHITGVGISGVVIAQNEILIDQAKWTTDPVTGKRVLGNANGITVDPKSDLPIAGLTISDNLVEYEMAGREAPVLASSGMAIGYWDSTARNITSDVTISRNRIVNAPATAIRWAANTKSLKISNNRIAEAGCSSSDSFPKSYRAAVMIAPNQPATDVVVSDNEIMAAQCTLAYGLEVLGGSCVLADGNTVDATGGAATGYLQYAHTTRDGCVRISRGAQLSPPLQRSMLPGKGVVEGSTVSDKEGKQWRYNGAGWILVTP